MIPNFYLYLFFYTTINISYNVIKRSTWLGFLAKRVSLIWWWRSERSTFSDLQRRSYLSFYCILISHTCSSDLHTNTVHFSEICFLRRRTPRLLMLHPWTYNCSSSFQAFGIRTSIWFWIASFSRSARTDWWIYLAHLAVSYQIPDSCIIYANRSCRSIYHI